MTNLEFLDMRRLTSLIVFLTAPLVASSAHATIGVDALGEASWYLHVDFEEMKKGPAGTDVYAWFQAEIFDEIKKETGIDLGSKLEQLTAFGRTETDSVVVLEGNFPKDIEEKLMQGLQPEGVSKKSVAGKTYWQIGEQAYEGKKLKVELDKTDEVYVSFALPKQIVAAFDKKKIEAVLKKGGVSPKGTPGPNALFVLSAERNLLQAGANADVLDEEANWDSKLVSNTKQVALLVADSEGKLAIDAKLKARKPEMAESMANVIRGLIGLSYFSEDMEPGIASLLRSTKVNVADGILELSVVLDPKAFKDIVED
ncbi:MAG: hypothetical protein AAF658_01245 [Myxococcota bacterium]